MGPPVSLLVEGRSKRPGGAPARRASGAPPSSARGGPGGDTGRHAAPHPEGFDPTLESPPDRHAAVSPALRLRDSPRLMLFGRGCTQWNGVGTAASRPETWMRERVAHGRAARH